MVDARLCANPNNQQWLSSDPVLALTRQLGNDGAKDAWSIGDVLRTPGEIGVV
jgi:hypothetical protein